MTTPKPATVHRWSDLPTDAPMPLIARQRIIADNVMISRVTLAKGFSVPSHRHENEQVAVVLSGRIRFGLGEEGAPAHHFRTLTSGEVVVLPSNLPHSAEALEDTVVLDVFSPPSEKTGVDRG